ncbi:TolC family protein, partial [Corallococcus praedator]|uniref:TolC family protein n=1 Tax=Corallococcus praedator TaxID=2316724 RepID=UPI0013153B6C
IRSRAETTSSEPTITLEEAYERTLASDQSIKIAGYEIRKANLLPWSALTRLGPQLSGNLSYDRAQQTSSGRSPAITSDGFITSSPRRGFTKGETRNIGASLEQPLVDFTVFPAFRLGRLSATVAQLEHRFTIRETLFGV